MLNSKRIPLIFSLIFFAINLSAQEIMISAEGIDLFGTLTIPEKEDVKTICIIVPGSGPTDRDGNNQFGLKTNTYKLLAEALAENGIASFRYDKRGAGKSVVEGVDAINIEKNMLFETNIKDLKSVINNLKGMNKFEKIFLIGHSEGSLVSILCAKEEKIDGIISIAGVGKNAGDLFIEQLEQQLAKPIVKEARRIIKSLKKGKKVENISNMLQSIFRDSVQAYLISWFKYEPRKELSSLNIPILVLHGSVDHQVAIENAKLLASAKKETKVAIIDGMTHMIKQVENEEDEFKTYSDDSYPIPKKLVDEIITFVK
ncbi:MAG: alpha/beta hydrolase [Treponema sp.]